MAARHWQWLTLVGLMLFAAFILSTKPVKAAVRIADDRGGRISTYVDRYTDLRASGAEVMIDGLCASACTLVLSAISHERICVTPSAKLGFHAAWQYGPKGRTVTSIKATQMIYAMYPQPVRKWIDMRGGLTSRMIFLRGKQLRTLYKPCYLKAGPQ